MSRVDKIRTFKPIHVMWSTFPTKQHRSDDDTDQLGTGPDGWALFVEGEEDEGYFAWFHHKAEAEHVVEQHNAAVEDAEALESLRHEIGLLPITLQDSEVGPIVAAVRHLPGSIEAGKVPGVVEALEEAAAERRRREA